MSGPIVRKYGFPNFEKIFGERKLEHGADEEEQSQATARNDSQPKADQTCGSTPDQAVAAQKTESK